MSGTIIAAVPAGVVAAVGGGTGGTYEPNRFVTNLRIEKLGLANKLVWENKETLNSTATTTFSLYRTIMNKISREYEEGEYETLVTDASNNYASTNTYIDRDISMNTFYKYKFEVPSINTGQFLKYYGTTQSFFESPLNTKVTYDYKNDFFYINYDHINYLKKNSFANMDEKSWLSYYIWIEEEVTDSSNNLVYYETTPPTSITDSKIREDSNSITISETTTRKGGAANVSFNLSTYNFYITPTFYQDVSGSTFPGNIEFIDLLNDYDLSSNGLINSMQNASYTIVAPPPKELKITSSYSNGKISFEWNKLENPETSSYVIKITNTDEPIRTSSAGERYYKNPREITINSNNYTIDNTDLSIQEAYSPGSYNVVVLAKYNNLTSANSNTVTFTIPVTPISLEVKFIGQDNISITNNLVNQVKRVELKWNQFGYATLYKLQVKQYDKDGTQKETLTYYNHPSSYNKFFTRNLPWDYNPNKARFTCEVSYTTDHDINNGVPSSSFNDLGDQWLP